MTGPDYGYARRGYLYRRMHLIDWVGMLEGEDPDDREVRESHGITYQVPDFPADTLCPQGCGLTYGDITSGKIRECEGVPGTVTLWWNGDAVEVHGFQLTAAGVLAQFMEEHPDLRFMGLGLFTMGNVELAPGAGIRSGEQLILRPRAAH